MEHLDVEELVGPGTGVPLARERRQLADDLGQVGEVTQHLGTQVAGPTSYDVGDHVLGCGVGDPVVAQVDEALPSEPLQVATYVVLVTHRQCSQLRDGPGPRAQSDPQEIEGTELG